MWFFDSITTLRFWVNFWRLPPFAWIIFTCITKCHSQLIYNSQLIFTWRWYCRIIAFFVQDHSRKHRTQMTQIKILREQSENLLESRKRQAKSTKWKAKRQILIHMSHMTIVNGFNLSFYSFSTFNRFKKKVANEKRVTKTETNITEPRTVLFIRFNLIIQQKYFLSSKCLSLSGKAHFRIDK